MRRQLHDIANLVQRILCDTVQCHAQPVRRDVLRQGAQHQLVQSKAGLFLKAAIDANDPPLHRTIKPLRQNRTRDGIRPVLAPKKPSFRHSDHDQKSRDPFAKSDRKNGT
jgi:hypothetical protein